MPCWPRATTSTGRLRRSEEHTSELQSQFHVVCRLLLEKKKTQDGAMPLNTHRRLLSYSHCGVGGAMAHLVETDLQMTGRAGNRQVREVFFVMLRRERRSTLFPYTTLFR